MSSFWLFKGLNKTVDPEEVKALMTELLEYDKLPMPQMTEKLRQLDYNYPKPFGIAEFFKSTYFIIGVIVAVILLLLMGIGLACWKCQVFRMFCFSMCQRRKTQNPLPVPQPWLIHPTTIAEGGEPRKRMGSTSSTSSSSTESAGKGRRPPLLSGEYQPTDLAELPSDLRILTRPVLCWILWT